MSKKPHLILIRDGWGSASALDSNAITSANTPNDDRYMASLPNTLITANGLDVGLPAGLQGNSEVGHLNIGSGRVMYQMLTRIDKSITDGDFFDNNVLNDAIDNCEANNSALHIMGLVQDQGVHAITRHTSALLELAKKRNFNNVLIHVFSDGRDTPPKSSAKYITELQNSIDKSGVGRIASITGRYYSMDRDTNWDRVEVAYNALVKGEGAACNSWESAIESAYADGENDEFIKPRLIDFSGIQDKDSVIFTNYRLDRARELAHAFTDTEFTEFKREKRDINFVAFSSYYDNGNFNVAYPPVSHSALLGEVLANAGKTQVRCAETEKYAHVTFFFNGSDETPFKNEDRILVNSPKVATYDLKPEMSIYEVKDKLLEALKKDIYDVFIVNYANCDMVGHTGVFDAIVKAVEAVDECTGLLVDAVVNKGGVALVLADHGNAEQTVLEDGSTMTAHTINKVPMFMAGSDKKLKAAGKLADVAPTLLELMGIEQPKEMDGSSLLV